MIELQSLQKDLGIFNNTNLKSMSDCNRVAICWYNFSSFIPGFLTKISQVISQNDIKQRILQIVAEENGEGLAFSHSELFKIAMTQSGLTVESVKIRSICKFENAFNHLLHQETSEAFAVGVSFGLEIIAEENINYLLENTSYSDECFKAHAESLFFKIHLVNEIEHIEKCYLNVNAIEREDFDSLFAGITLSLNFWKEFWQEAMSA